MDDTGLNPTCCNCTTACDREDVLDRHEERLFIVTWRNRNVLIYCIHQLHDLSLVLRVAVERSKSGTADNRSVVSIEVVESKKVANLHLYEIKHFRIVNKVNLVKENDDSRHVHLTGEQDVLTGLRHRTIGSCHYEDCTIHLSGTGYHVLHIVGVARAVNVCVVTLCSLILYVRSVDCDTSFLLLRSVVDRVERTYI